MGCDIHFVVETKYNDRWIGIFQTGGVYAWQPPYELRTKCSPFHQFKDRDYEFFGQLAGVRRDGPDPLGIPEDCSDLTRMNIEYWGSDGHSHSYCSLREFVLRKFHADEKLAADAMRNKITDDAPDPVAALLNINNPDDAETEALDNSRVVFWFDN